MSNSHVNIEQQSGLALPSTSNGQAHLSLHGATDEVHTQVAQVALHRATHEEIVEIAVEALGIAVDKVRQISEEAVAELVEKDETKWAPLKVRAWPAEWAKPSPAVAYHVMCGNHRTRAAQLKGLTTLPAIVVVAETDLEWTKLAIADNLGHGRNFTAKENEANAKRLAKQGQTVTQIAEFLGYNKSTVSRWLSGADAHAADKQKEAGKRSEGATYTLSLPQGIGTDTTKQKVMGLVTIGRITASCEEASAYIATLKPTQRESLTHLQAWLAEVLLHG